MVNQRGLEFYGRLVDHLLEAGIAPMVTLYHWDLPAALDERGAGGHPRCRLVRRLCERMYKALDDRVRQWATLKEPWVVTYGGDLHGGSRLGTATASRRRSRGQLLRAHGAAVEALRAAGRHRSGSRRHRAQVPGHRSEPTLPRSCAPTRS